MSFQSWCVDAVTALDGNNVPYCVNADQFRLYDPATGITYNPTELSTLLSTNLVELIATVDPDVVNAIFGAGLVMFVTGLGAGWLVNVIKQAR